jgi:hypothetical protein
MRQVLAVVSMVMVVGCEKSNDAPPVIDPPTVVCTGDLTITSAAEMDAFAARGCTEVTGYLSIQGTDLTSVSLPELRAVGTGIHLANIDPPPLVFGCSYPLSLGSVWAWTALAICSNANLASIDLPALETAHSLAVMGNSALVTLRLPTLKTVFGESGLASGGPITLVGGLGIANNPALTSIELPALTSIGMLAIEYNTSYPQCAAEALLAHLNPAPAWARRISGNDTTATCSPSCTSATASATTDRGDGTTILVCGAEKVLVCTNPDCSGITDLFIWGTDLTSVSLPRLTSVSGDLWVGCSLGRSGNTALVRFILPALTSVAGSLALNCNDVLTTVSLPALTTVGGDLNVYGSALTGLTLPALTTVSGLELWIAGNSALLNINLPELATTRSLRIMGNSALTSLALPALTSVGEELRISDNTSYPQCASESILAQLVSFTGTSTIFGNNTTATCPP